MINLGLRVWPVVSRFCAPSPLQKSLAFNFSQFFDKQDEKEIQDYIVAHHRKNLLYYTMVNRWKLPLQRKQRRNQRKRQLAAQRVPAEEQQAKLVVHNPALGVDHPPQLHKQFAIVQIDGFQYKVMEDTMLLLDTKPEHQLNAKIVFEDVPLIGTNSYTLIGRPSVGGARVQAIIESISDSQKVIVFKKKRRKQYKRSQGKRISLTQCRVTSIVHSLTENILEKAISLQ